MSTRLVVSGLGDAVTDESLRDAFVRFGPLVAATVVRDPVTGQVHGYGFVVFEQEAHARAAIADMNGKLVEGYPITVREDEPPPFLGGKRPG